MAKAFNYVMMIFGAVVILNLIGIPTMTNSIYNAMMGSNPVSSEAWSKIMTSILVGALATVIVGFYTRQSSESFIITGFASLLGGWVVADLWSIATINTGEAWMDSIIKLIMGSLIVGWMVVIIQWWRGNDII